MTLETKGKSRSLPRIIAARKLKVADPEMSMQAIKDKLKLGIHVIMVGCAIRGITHGHLDMCGLPVRPFEHRGEVKADVKRRATKPAGRTKGSSKVKKAKTEAPAAALAPDYPSGVNQPEPKSSDFSFCFVRPSGIRPSAALLPPAQAAANARKAMCRQHEEL
jgi:hypothetical protein